MRLALLCPDEYLLTGVLLQSWPPFAVRGAEVKYLLVWHKERLVSNLELAEGSQELL